MLWTARQCPASRQAQLGTQTTWPGQMGKVNMIVWGLLARSKQGGCSPRSTGHISTMFEPWGTTDCPLASSASQGELLNPMYLSFFMYEIGQC